MLQGSRSTRQQQVSTARRVDGGVYSLVVDKRRGLLISKAKVREAAAKNGDSHHHWGSKGQESALLIVTVAKHDMAPLFCFLFRECVCAPVHPCARIM